MKKLLLTTLLTLVSLNAFAMRGNDGPSGSPVKDRPPTVIAETKVSCGFCRPAGVHGVRVYSTGVVEAFTQDRGGPEGIEMLGQLGNRVLRNLQRDIEKLPVEELIDQDAGQPYCEDAPVTTVTVTRDDGTKQLIEREANCHVSTLSYGQGNGIRSLLKGFLTLSH